MPTSSSTPSSRAKAKLVVVDDDGVLRAHFIGALRRETDLDIIGECGSVASALALIPLKPDLVLLDLGLPDGNGIAVIDALRAHPSGATPLDRGGGARCSRGTQIAAAPARGALRTSRAKLAGRVSISVVVAGVVLAARACD